MIRPARALGAALLVAVLATGCGADEPDAKPAGSGFAGSQTKVERDGDKVTVEDGDGNVMKYGKGVELPDDFPEDVPLPEGDYQVNSVYEEDERTTMMLEFEAPDMKTLEEPLRSGLADAGYTVEDVMRIDDKSGEQLHFTGKSAEREVSVMLMVTPQDVATAVYTLTPTQG